MDSIWIGFDTREGTAFGVCRDSIKRHLSVATPIYSLVLDQLRRIGLYTRPTSIKSGGLWDDISQAPMATEFAISRFLTGYLAGEGYALFMDCDILVRSDLSALFDLCRRDPSKAVWCVKHLHEPKVGLKMNNQQQTRYSRKNWSSVMVWNVDHPSNKTVTVEMVNTLPGRDLHRFCWLVDEEIGELDVEWNWLVGYSPHVPDPKLVHFTSGGPWEEKYKDVPYAAEWQFACERWAGAA